jgi:hypothetical protein
MVGVFFGLLWVFGLGRIEVNAAKGTGAGHVHQPWINAFHVELVVTGQYT